jgi:DNA polymerase (family 10)
LLAAMKNPYVDGIAHPTTRLLMKRPPAAIDFDEVFKFAEITGTFFEINAFPDRLDLSPELIRKAKKHGLKFFIGTDAHALSHLALIKYGVITARRGWLEKKDVLNTLALQEILNEIKSRRLKRKELFK